MKLGLKKGLLYVFATAILAGAPLRDVLGQSPAPQGQSPDSLGFFPDGEDYLAKSHSSADGTKDLERVNSQWLDVLQRYQQSMKDSVESQKFQSFMERFSSLEDEPLRMQALEVNNKVNEYLSVATDSTVYKKADYYASPLESIKAKAGDSEDHALLKYFALRALGVPAERLYLSEVETENAKGEKGAHLILLMDIGENGKKQFVLLDSLFPDLAIPGSIPEGFAKPYKYLSAVNEQGSWFLSGDKTFETAMKGIGWTAAALLALDLAKSIWDARRKKTEPVVEKKTASAGGSPKVRKPQATAPYKTPAKSSARTLDLLTQAAKAIKDKKH